MKNVKLASFKDMCFYIFLFFILLYYSFRKVMINYNVLNFSIYAAIPFFILKFILEDKYTAKELIVNIALITLGVISTILIGNTSILISFCVVIGMKNINYKTALKIFFWMKLISCILVMIGAITGLISNVSYDRADGTMRISMGYTHPNTLGIYCFVLISLWFILYGEKRWKLKALISFCLNILQFLLTNSRTSFLLICAYLIMIVYSKCKTKSRIFALISPIAMIMGFAVNILLPLTIGTPIGNILNRLLNSRITLSNSFLKVYGIDLFGKEIANKVGDEYWHLDSGFLNMFIQFGALIGIIYLICCFITAKNVKTYNNSVHIAIITFSFYGIIEDVLTSLLFTYLWIIIGAAYYLAVNKKRKSLKAKILETLKLREYKL